MEQDDLVVDPSRARLEALGDLVSLVSAARSYRELLTVMARESRSALGAATISLSRFESEYGRLRTLVNHGALGPHEEPLPSDEVYYFADHPAAARMLDSEHSYVQVLGQDDADEFTQGLLRDEGKQSCMVLPVMFEGRVWGEFWATRTALELDFTSDDLDYGRLVVAQISGGIAQAEYFARVERYAYTDELTGLANRRMFEQKLDEALDACQQSGLIAGLVISDLNGLKRLNDDYGHEVGDNALREFGKFMAQTASLRPGTLAARLGGDEFALLTSGLAKDQVVELARHLSGLSSTGIADGAAVGVATSDDLFGPMLTRGHLLRAADAAQARAKRSRLAIPVLASPAGESVDPDELTVHELERRRIRGQVAHSPLGLLNRICIRLDEMGAALPRELLSMIGDETALATNSATWWLSRRESGGDVLVTTAYGAARIPDDNLPDSYTLSDFPMSQLALGGEVFILDVEDITSDPAETMLMSSIGVTELLMTGGVDRFGNGWLLEIPADSLSYPLKPYANVVRAAVALALRS